MLGWHLVLLAPAETLNSHADRQQPPAHAPGAKCLDLTAGRQPLPRIEQGGASASVTATQSVHHSSHQDNTRLSEPPLLHTTEASSVRGATVTSDATDAFFSQEREEAFAAMLKHVYSSHDFAQAAGQSEAPSSMTHPTLREWFDSIRILYPEQNS